MTFSRIYQKITRTLGTTKPADPIYKHGVDGFDGLLRKMNEYFTVHPDLGRQFQPELQFLNTVVKTRPEAEKLIYAVMPYPFTLQLDHRKVAVFRDETVNMFYVYLNGKRLYYHRGFTKEEDVQKSFTYITAEQDPASPHAYLGADFSVTEGDVVADFGAAEGNFSLMVVDIAKEIFILEADPIWMEALQKTFEPWKEKVHIINKYAGTVVNDSTTTIEELFGAGPLDALKMDIEGAEISVLEKSSAFISQRNLKLAITTYHRATDAENIQKLLADNGYHTAYSDKYMLFVYDDLLPPYFRKGLLKASRRPAVTDTE